MFVSVHHLRHSKIISWSSQAITLDMALYDVQDLIIDDYRIWPYLRHPSKCDFQASF